MNRPGIIQITVAIVLALAVALILHTYVFNAISEKLTPHLPEVETTSDPDQNQNLDIDDIVRRVNGQCPYTVNSETRLDSVAEAPGNKLLAYGTFFNKAMNTSDTALFKSLVYPVMKERLKREASVAAVLKSGITIVLLCYDGNGNHIVNLYFTPDMISE